jgi:hypothetical protein
VPPQPQPSSVVGPRSSTPPTEDPLSQLDRIERAIEAMQKRLDAIDATLARVLSRK